jgi:hypothetical protein
MRELIVQVSGWIPAFIVPTATSIQLWKIIKNKSSEGVSWVTWFLFGIANLGLYVYAEKYSDLQAIIGLFLTAVIDFVIVGMVFFAYKK